MRLHRFYIDKKIDEEKIFINENGLVHQWKNVFRFNVGGEMILFDGSGFEYNALIEKIGNREVVLEITRKRRGILPKINITLYQSLIKKDKMEWVVEKATELGVSKIVPIVSDRSEKKGFNVERARKITIEASEQCGRADVPELIDITSLDEALEKCKNIIIFDKSGEGMNCEKEKNILVHNSYPTNRNSICILIGPEGGWSPRELQMFKQKSRLHGDGISGGIKICSLGPLTLRAETASVVALTLIGVGGGVDL